MQKMIKITIKDKSMETGRAKHRKRGGWNKECGRSKEKERSQKFGKKEKKTEGNIERKKRVYKVMCKKKNKPNGKRIKQRKQKK